MKNRMFMKFFIAAWACSLHSAVSAEGAPDPALLRKLGAETFRDREEAQAKLLEWGKSQRNPAMEWLHARMMSETDPELRRRITSVLRDLVLEEYRKEGDGYIGIHMMPAAVEVPGDQEARYGIRVTNVVPGSAGAKGGLVLGDTIVAAGGTSWRRENAMDLFQKQIRNHKPGSEMKLRVLRGDKELDVTVILERRIKDLPNRGSFASAQDLADQKKREEDAHFEGWLKERTPAQR
jgi:predicted metalloprotease with PDZ domain